MYTRQDGYNAVVTAIEANGTDVASRDEYDIDGIIDDIYEETGAYDIEAVDHDIFWEIVERHETAAR